MDQKTPFGTTSGSDMGTGVATGSGPGTGSSGAFGAEAATDSGVCPHCGKAMGQNRGLEEFLGKIGISEEMITNLRSQMQNVDVEEYLNTAREYLKTAGDKLKDGSNKATQYSKEHPGKVAAGVAVLAVGAGLLINALSRDRS